MKFAIIIVLVALPIAALLRWLTHGGDVAESVSEQIGLAPEHDKLGWMDDAPLTDADRRRIAQITGQPFGSSESVIRAIQAGARGNLTRRDFELLRQDRRRARAAYPDVRPDQLLAGGWFNVDLADRVPDRFCTSHNSNASAGPDGKWYLDGGCYMSFVRADYDKRADAAATKAFFAEERRREREAKIARLREEGPYVFMAGTSGSLSVRLDKPSGNVVVQHAANMARTAKRWTFPFVLEEWIEVNPLDLEAIKKLPSFAAAHEEQVDVAPSGVVIGRVTSSGRTFDGTLQPGEALSSTAILPTPGQ